MNKNYIIGGLSVLVLILIVVVMKGVPKLPEQATPLSNGIAEPSSAPPPPATPGIGQTSPPPGTPKTTPAPIKPSATSAKVIFTITDAAANLENVRSIDITLKEVKLHNRVKGWIAIPNTRKTFDLRELEKEEFPNIIAEANLESGEYTQLWISVEKVTLTKFDGSTAAAKLPSGIIRFPVFMKLTRGETANVTFDFEANKSFHTATNGTYIFMPRLVISIQNALLFATPLPSGELRTGGGTAGMKVTLGMDENGNVSENFLLHPLTHIELIGDVMKLRAYDMSEENLATSAARALEIAIGGSYIEKAVTIKLLNKDFWQITGTQNSSPKTVRVEIATGKVIE